MYTEILRIIEGGLAKDTKKVYSYSKLLAEKNWARMEIAGCLK